jgi:hypothetical protein
MDPITILALAKTSYSAIKAGIAVGKEMQGMAKDLAGLWKAVGQLTQIAADPKAGLMSGKTLEQVAMEAYAAKAEAMKMMHDIEMQFITEHGLAGWDSVRSMVIEMRKKQRRLEEEEQKRQEELFEVISFVGKIVGAFVLVVFIVVSLLLTII